MYDTFYDLRSLLRIILEFLNRKMLKVVRKSIFEFTN